MIRQQKNKYKTKKGKQSRRIKPYATQYRNTDLSTKLIKITKPKTKYYYKYANIKALSTRTLHK